jgi:uncharacterized protein (DUF305 family)
MIPRRRLAPLMLVVALGLSACGGKASSHANTSATNPSGASPSMSIKLLSGADLDRAFVQGMVPHHQAAIDMAAVEVQKGKDPRTKALAQAIIDDQQREIAQMTQIAQAQFKLTPMKEMSGPLGTLMGVPLSMDMSKMGQDLATAPNTDHAFLTTMIPHHASAILMANEENNHGGDPQLRTLSQSIIAAQAKEIGEMQALLTGGI